MDNSRTAAIQKLLANRANTRAILAEMVVDAYDAARAEREARVKAEGGPLAEELRLAHKAINDLRNQLRVKDGEIERLERRIVHRTAGHAMSLLERARDYNRRHNVPTLVRDGKVLAKGSDGEYHEV